MHRDAATLLTPEARAALAEAVDMRPEALWNVIRIQGTRVGLLAYDEFDARTFPRLWSSTSVDLASRVASTRSYADERNPFVLHRKELLVRPDDPRREGWEALTARLAALGLFTDPCRIGRERQWERILAAAGLDLDGRTT